MFTIAYYRDALDKYKDNNLLKEIIEKSRNLDYIIKESPEGAKKIKGKNDPKNLEKN